MLTVDQLIRSIQFRQALGLPLEGCATPRCPRDDEHPPSAPHLPTKETEDGKPDALGFIRRTDPHTGEYLYFQVSK